MLHIRHIRVSTIFSGYKAWLPVHLRISLFCCHGLRIDGILYIAYILVNSTGTLLFSNNRRLSGCLQALALVTVPQAAIMIYIQI